MWCHVIPGTRCISYQCGRWVINTIPGTTTNINIVGSLTCVVHAEPVAKGAFSVAILVSKTRTEERQQERKQRAETGTGIKHNTEYQQGNRGTQTTLDIALDFDRRSRFRAFLLLLKIHYIYFRTHTGGGPSNALVGVLPTHTVGPLQTHTEGRPGEGGRPPPTLLVASKHGSAALPTQRWWSIWDAHCTHNTHTNTNQHTQHTTHTTHTTHMTKIFHFVVHWAAEKNSPPKNTALSLQN